MLLKAGAKGKWRFAGPRYCLASRVVRPAGLEPATYGLEGRCTIRLCYERIEREYATGHSVGATELTIYAARRRSILTKKGNERSTAGLQGAGGAALSP